MAIAVVVSGPVFTCNTLRALLVVLQRTKRYWTRWWGSWLEYEMLKTSSIIASNVIDKL